MQRQQFTFYRSFWSAIQSLPKKEQLPFVLTLIAYALDGEELPLSGSAATAFCLVRPVLDVARRKAESGKKGGSSPKQTGSKPEANRKQTGSKREGEIEREIEVEVEGEIENECYIPPSPSDDGDTPLAGGEVVLVVVGALGELSSAARAELEGFVRDMGEECVYKALDAARDAGKSTWAYVRGVLRRKYEQGVRSAQDWDRLEQQRERTRGQYPRDSIAGTPRDVQPTPERARDSADWLEEFLAEQEEGKS